MAKGGFRRLVFVSVGSVVLACAPLLGASASQKSGDAATASGPARAAEAPRQAASPDAAAQKTAAALQALPFQLEGTDLGRMLKRDASNLMVRRARDGATMLDLAGGFRSVLVLHTDANGAPVISCIASEKQAQAIFAPVEPKAADAAKEP